MRKLMSLLTAESVVAASSTMIHSALPACFCAQGGGGGGGSGDGGTKCSGHYARILRCARSKVQTCKKDARRQSFSRRVGRLYEIVMKIC